MSVLPVGFGSSGGAYQIDNSLRFRSSASAYLSRTQGVSTSSQKATWSFWYKRGKTNTLYDTLYAGSTGSAATGDLFGILNNSGNQFRVFFRGGTDGDLTTTQLFRDFSAWYHIVLAVDTTQSTASNRLKLYINGAQVTAFATASYPALNYNMTQFFANGNINRIGYNPDTSEYLDGYLTEYYGINGQALDPSYFGETNADGVWVPKAYTGTYGTNGFYLPFNDATSTTTLGYDQSSNSNNWTCNNISLTAGSTYDSMVDTPTNGANGQGNYSTLNPVDIRGSGTATLSNANLSFRNTGIGYPEVGSTISLPQTGKWYFESKVSTPNANYNGVMIGTKDTTNVFYHSQWNGSRVATVGSISVTPAAVTGDVIGIAVDCDNNYFWVSLNNSWYLSGNPSTGANPRTDAFPKNVPNFWAWSSVSVLDVGHDINFGQRPFAYTPPTGFNALCTANLPQVAIANPGEHFDVSLYTGTGSTQSITGLDFQPDWVWIKERSGAADHGLYDAVRGVQKQLESNQTGAESTETTGLTAFGSDGFTVGALAQLNTNTDTYVAWNWKANGTGVSNTDGSITSTVSANQTAGFSIVTASASGTSPVTVGHGLGATPNMIIGRVRNNTANWYVYHSSIAASDYLVLNSTAAKATSSNIWDVAPTSTVFTIGNPQNGWNGGTAGSYNYVAYCFSEIAGYSKFGSYTGNGSTDGPFVYCGFRPRYVMIKVASGATNDWCLYDTSRSQYNITNAVVAANSSQAESAFASGYNIDTLSNGFKVRDTTSAVNGSGNTLIFAAFAEHPFGGSNISPSPAR